MDNNSRSSPRRNGGGNIGQINVISSGVSGPPPPSLQENNNDHDHHGNKGNGIRGYKKLPVRYKECLKNHAAAVGGNATDGCGEFMPSGEEGSIEALKCSACNCHRNFHRKEIECDCPFPFDCYHSSHQLLNNGRKLILGPPHNYILASPAAAAGAAPPHHQQQRMMSNKGGSIPSETDEKDDNGGGRGGAKATAGKVRKRFRTKFSQEQKEKMLNFAEKAEWRIQKLDESVVQQFCQEIGIKRRVLKVWMHNNKQNLAKKLDDDVPG